MSLEIMPLENNLLPVGQSGSLISRYKQISRSIGALDAQQERDLLKKFKLQQCLESAHTLVLSQLRTVVRIVQGYKNYGLPEEDLLQEGTIGLMKAVRNYDLKQNVRLYSYALLWIKAEVQSYVLKNWKIVKIGTTKNLKKLFFNFRKTQKDMIDQGVDKRELYNYISQKLAVLPSEVKEIEGYFKAPDIPLLAQTQGDDFISVEESNYALISRDNRCPAQLIDTNTPELIAQESMDGRTQGQQLQKALLKLDKRERLIIEHRFLAQERKTHKELAAILGLSSERVRQLEGNALNALRVAVEI